MRPAVEKKAQCKICGADATLFGVTDFSKSCLEIHGPQKTDIYGVPVYYRRCESCGFLYTEFCDDWSQHAFSKYIYNDEYVKVDPDYIEARPHSYANMLSSLFESSMAELSILDYGGGNGLTARLLSEKGFQAASYDPIADKDKKRPDATFNLVTCFEVLEHTHDPLDTAKQLANFVQDDGIILFSTLLVPNEIDALGVNWWYLAPRNGHISLYSKEALGHLWNQVGLNYFSINSGYHMAYREAPAFARHLFVNASAA